ncbi:MAG: YceI family protein [Rhodanobacter sp.]
MFHVHARTWLFWLAATLLPFAPAQAATWRYDTVHSQIVFSISHNGYSRPFGRLHVASGWLHFDPDDWSHATTELDIDLQGLDMGDAAWNKAVCKKALLDCSAHRYAHFKSTRIERTDAQHGVLHGELSLRGVTRPVSIPFTFNRSGTTIFGLHDIAGFSATAMLDRNDFGMHAYAASIGEHVSVWLELEAIREHPSSREQP